MAEKLMMIDVDNAEINPEDMQLGQDPDGMPRTEPSEKAKADAAKTAKAEPAKPDPELVSLREKFAQAERDRDARTAEAATEKASRESERVAREKAEASGLEDRTFAWRTHMANLQKDKQLIDTGLESVTNAQASAERELQSAEEAGDVARKIAATKALTIATSRIEEYQRGKAGIEAEIARNKDPYEQFEAAVSARSKEPKEPVKEVKPETKPAPIKNPTTPDEFIAVAPHAVRNWLAEHREYADPDSDEHVDLNAFAAKWLRKHNRDEKSLDTPAFVAALDAQFAPKQEEAVNVAEEEEPEVVETAPKTQPRKTTPSAPVSRSATPGRSQGTTEIGLDLAEQQTATQMYPDLDRNAALKRYAKNKAMALRDGLYERRA